MLAGRITVGRAGQKFISAIIQFLRRYWVSTWRAVLIFKTYGTDAKQVISEKSACNSVWRLPQMTTFASPLWRALARVERSAHDRRDTRSHLSMPAPFIQAFSV